MLIPAPRVLIVTSDPRCGPALAEASRQSGLVVIAQTPDRRGAVELAAHYRPDVVLIDATGAEARALHVTERIAADADVKVVLLCAFETRDLALRGVRAGAVGLLPLDLDGAALGKAVRGVCAGEAAFSRSLTRALVNSLCAVSVSSAGLRPVRSVLSDREWEVLDLVCSGTAASEIAERLGLSAETARSHVRRIKRKLRVGTLAEATTVARRMREERSSLRLAA